MPFFRINGMRVHIKLGGKKSSRPKPCCAPVEVGGQRIHCEAMSSILCDWPVEGGTCDAPLCSDHATSVGLDLDYCPRHASMPAPRQAQATLF